MITLTIDTSTNILGVAILKESELIAQKITRVNQDHSSRLMPAIVELMNDVNIKPNELGKIVVAEGPGSYTGIRIGVTVAKSLAWSLNIPIIAVSSLESLAYQAQLKDGLVCSFFDARRNNVFAGIYRFDKGVITSIKPDANLSFKALEAELLSMNEEVILLSPDIDKFKSLMTDDIKLLATIPEPTYHIANPVNLAFIAQGKSADNLHQLTPEYLRMAEAEVNWLKAKEKGSEK